MDFVPSGRRCQCVVLSGREGDAHNENSSRYTSIIPLSVVVHIRSYNTKCRTGGRRSCLRVQYVNDKGTTEAITIQQSNGRYAVTNRQRPLLLGPQAVRYVRTQGGLLQGQHLG